MSERGVGELGPSLSKTAQDRTKRKLAARFIITARRKEISRSAPLPLCGVAAGIPNNPPNTCLTGR